MSLYVIASSPVQFFVMHLYLLLQRPHPTDVVGYEKYFLELIHKGEDLIKQGVCSAKEISYISEIIVNWSEECHQHMLMFSLVTYASINWFN